MSPMVTRRRQVPPRHGIAKRPSRANPRGTPAETSETIAADRGFEPATARTPEPLESCVHSWGAAAALAKGIAVDLAVGPVLPGPLNDGSGGRGAGGDATRSLLNGPTPLRQDEKCAGAATRKSGSLLERRR